ncbi:hypothetical protein ACFL4W_02420 [Planctomycetota bacterium]
MTVKAIDMIRKIRDRNYKQTREMSAAEQIDYYRKKAEALRKKPKNQTTGS